MALTGVHIVFSGNRVSGGGSLPAGADFSQTMATAATSNPNPDGGPSLLSINASAPIFYAVGPNPDASGTAGAPRRYMDPANGREDIFVNAGDKFAWVFA